jgi:hypothetical protein
METKVTYEEWCRIVSYKYQPLKRNWYQVRLEMFK